MCGRLFAPRQEIWNLHTERRRGRRSVRRLCRRRSHRHRPRQTPGAFEATRRLRHQQNLQSGRSDQYLWSRAQIESAVPLRIRPSKPRASSQAAHREIGGSTNGRMQPLCEHAADRRFLSSRYPEADLPAPFENRLRNDMSYVASRSRISQKLNGFLVITKFMLSSRNLVSPNHTTVEPFAQRIAER